MMNPVVVNFLFCLSLKSFGSVFISTIMKSGSHLLHKCVKMLCEGTDRRVLLSHPQLDVVFKDAAIDAHPQVIVTHLPYNKKFAALFKKNNTRLILLIRDPRDVIVSMAHFIKTHPGVWSDVYGQEISSLDLSLHQKIDRLLYSVLIQPWLFQDHHPVGIVAYYRKFLLWKQRYSRTHIIKFEDLVGPCGGGSFEQQFSTVSYIASLLSVSLEKEKLVFICKKLFGGTGTFRSGIVGAWKKCLTKNQIDYFNREENRIFISNLGYDI